MTNFNYEEDSKINLDSLELDAQDVSELLMKYGREKARLSKDLANAEEDIKIIRSQIIKDFLEENKENAKKPTGVEIEAHYRTHKDHLKAKEKWIDIQYELNLLSAAVSAIYKKADMISEQRALLGMGYYSRTSKTNGFRQKINKEAIEEVSKEMREKVNRKRRSK